MHVAALQLAHFRNYRRLALSLPCGPVALVGDNAQGKSNLVDALHILATGRSVRPGPDASWLHVHAPAGAPFARIAARVVTAAREVELEVVVARARADAAPEASVRRRVRIGGAAARLSELPGHLRVVCFTPGDLTLFAGAPSERRRWLDLALAQLDRDYLLALTAYEEVLIRRNVLLRTLATGRGGSAELHFWDERLASPAAVIVQRRRAYLADLAPAMRAEFERVAGGGELAAAYVPHAPAVSVAEFAQALVDRRALDIQRGATSVGPHRDDVEALLDGRSLAHFGSRGQLRLAALAAKLAQFYVATQRSGEPPVMLLDDIAAELDPTHRALLLARLPVNVQVIMTTADPGALDPAFLAQARRLTVREGVVEGVGVGHATQT